MIDEKHLRVGLKVRIIKNQESSRFCARTLASRPVCPQCPMFLKEIYTVKEFSRSGGGGGDGFIIQLDGPELMCCSLDNFAHRWRTYEFELAAKERKWKKIK